MSWDSYIDNLIGHTSGACDKACIIGKDGSKWTTDANPKSLQITAAEAQTLGRCMSTGDYTPLQASGILIEGIKYQFLRGEENLALGKKKDHGALTIQCTKTACVIGHTAEGDLIFLSKKEEYFFFSRRSKKKTEQKEQQTEV